MLKQFLLSIIMNAIFLKSELLPAKRMFLVLLGETF